MVHLRFHQCEDEIMCNLIVGAIVLVGDPAIYVEKAPPYECDMFVFSFPCS